MAVVSVAAFYFVCVQIWFIGINKMIMYYVIILVLLFLTMNFFSFRVA